MKGYEYLLRFLNEQGIRIYDEEGLFAFGYEGHIHYVSKEDSPRLKVFLIMEPDGYSRTQRLEAFNKLNSRQLFLKFCTFGESGIQCSYEAEISDETTSAEFSEILTLLADGTTELLAELKK